MQLPQEGALLCIFIGEADKVHGEPLYEWVVLQARERSLAGATALRGMMSHRSRPGWPHLKSTDQILSV